MNNPLVSVVIPTKGRPTLLNRAIASVFSQTFSNYEIVIVIDGEDSETEKMIQELNNEKINAIVNPKSVGGAEARNVGVFHSKGKWIAFLDDDDEWYPNKLELQYNLSNKSISNYPICYSKVIGRSPNADYIWPRREINMNEPISNYLLVRNSLQQGEGLIQTTMIFTKKELLMRVPFNGQLKRHQEWDWLLRVSMVEGVRFEFVPEILSIWYVEEERKSISTQSDWRFSVDWIRGNKNLVTKRAYSAFLMTVVSGIAARQKDVRGFFFLLFESLKGKPKVLDFMLFFTIWMVPFKLRRKVRDAIKSLKSA